MAQISTRRFATIDEINMDTLEQFYGGESQLTEEQASFHSDDSYDLLCIGPAM